MSCCRHNCLIHRGPASFPMVSANNSWRRQKYWGGTSESCPKPIHVFLTSAILCCPGAFPLLTAACHHPVFRIPCLPAAPGTCSCTYHSSPEPSPPSACSLPPTKGWLETHLLPTCHSAVTGAIRVDFKSKTISSAGDGSVSRRAMAGYPICFSGPKPPATGETFIFT